MQMMCTRRKPLLVVVLVVLVVAVVGDVVAEMVRCSRLIDGSTVLPASFNQVMGHILVLFGARPRSLLAAVADVIRRARGLGS